MALNATFTTDFSDFYAAVQKAEAHLKGFETSANRVGSALDRMGDQFSGRKILQEATLMTRAIESAGLASKLTEQEMRKWTQTIGQADEKMKALGMRTSNVDAFTSAIGRGNAQTSDSFKALFTNVDKTTTATSKASDQFRATFTEAPKQVTALTKAVAPMPDSFDALKSTVLGVGGALGIAFSGTAVIQGIKAQIDAAYAYADTVTNLSAATGIGVVALQKLEAIGVSSGVSMQDLAGAVGAMQRQLDDPKAQQALRGMGIDYGILRQLRPEDQFLTLARAVSQIKDPIERANTGALIFKGTWSTIAPAINKDVQTIIDQAKTLSDAQIAAMSRSNDNWSTFFHNFHVGVMGMIADYELGQQAAEKYKFWGATGSDRTVWQQKPVDTPNLPAAPAARVGNVTGFVGAHVTGFVDPKIISELKVGGQTLDEQSTAIDRNAASQKAWASIADKTKTATVALTLTQARQIDAWMKTGVTASEAADALRINERAVSQYMDAQRDLAKVIPVTNAGMAKFEDLVSHSALRSGLTQINRDTEALTGTLSNFTGKFKGAEMFPEPPSTTFDAWKKTQTAVTETMPMMMRLGENMKTFIGKDFGKIVVSSLAGGGSAVKATLAGFGNDLFSKEGAFGKSIGSGIEGIFGKTGMAGKIGGMIGGMVPIIGSFIGPAIEGMTKLFGKVFGKSEETKSVSPLRDEFFKMQGGLESLNPRVMELTGSLDLVQAVFDASTVEGYNTALANLNTVLQAESEKLVALQTDYANVETRLGTLTMISPGVEEALAKVFDATDPESYRQAVDELNGAMDAQEGTTKALDEAMQKYGISWTSLGSQAKNAKVAETTKGITAEFDVLHGAGVDVNEIMRKMGPSINTFVEQARISGAEVPEGFRRIIQTAIDAGEIFDADKKKISDMKETGLTFGSSVEDSMKKAADGMSNAIGKLIELIEKRLGPAIKNIPDGKFTVTGTYKPPKDMPAGAEPPGFATGTHGKFVDFGAGSLVMLHGKEAVVPEGDTRGLSGGTSSGATGDSSGVTVQIDARGALFNDPGSDQRLAALVERALSARHGLTHRRRAA